MSFGFLLRRGAVAGAAAGVVASVLVYLLVEPVIRRALVVEEARESMHAGHHEEPLVSRGMQVFGGMLTEAVVGVLFGVVFAVVFARLRHRLLARTDFGRSVLLAALGFAVFALLPALKYPANPPGVGDPATITERTLLYVLCLLAGLFVVFAVAGVNRWLSGRGLPPPRRVSLDVLVAVALLAAVMLALPGSPDTVPGDMPASLLWEFRLASLAQLGGMWAALGLTFGMLVDVGARRSETAVPVTA